MLLPPTGHLSLVSRAAQGLPSSTTSVPPPLGFLLFPTSQLTLGFLSLISPLILSPHTWCRLFFLLVSTLHNKRDAICTLTTARALSPAHISTATLHCCLPDSRTDAEPCPAPPANKWQGQGSSPGRLTSRTGHVPSNQFPTIP